VSGNTGDQTVLFEAAVNGKAVLTGDDAQVGDVGSAMLKQFNYRLFWQRVFKEK
jgi:hypothetical protein